MYMLAYVLGKYKFFVHVFGLNLEKSHRLASLREMTIIPTSLDSIEYNRSRQFVYERVRLTNFSFRFLSNIYNFRPISPLF